jgi:hypothetical protein
MDAWTALVEGWEQSIACVFFPSGSANYGKHVTDPNSCSAHCYCHKLYGEQKVQPIFPDDIQLLILITCMLMALSQFRNGAVAGSITGCRM